MSRTPDDYKRTRRSRRGRSAVLSFGNAIDKRNLLRLQIVANIAVVLCRLLLPQPFAQERRRNAQGHRDLAHRFTLLHTLTDGLQVQCLALLAWQVALRLSMPQTRLNALHGHTALHLRDTCKYREHKPANRC